jgi:hypothetical protein
MPGGFFDRQSSDNPFQTYNYVYVPYCTGDAHAGSNVVQYGSMTAMHVGYRNMTAYLSRIVPTFPSAASVVLAGSSAGGLGALYNWGQAQQAFGATPVLMIDDSLAVMPPDVASLSTVQATIATQWNLAATLPAGCTSCSTSFAGLFPYFASAMPGDRAALLSYVEDSVVPTFYEITTGQFEQGLAELLTDDIAPYDNLASFTVDASGHVLFFDPSLTNVDGGVSVAQFVSEMVTGNSAWTTVGP